MVTFLNARGEEIDAEEAKRQQMGGHVVMHLDGEAATVYESIATKWQADDVSLVEAEAEVAAEEEVVEAPAEEEAKEEAVEDSEPDAESVEPEAPAEEPEAPKKKSAAKKEE